MEYPCPVAAALSSVSPRTNACGRRSMMDQIERVLCLNVLCWIVCLVYGAPSWADGGYLAQSIPLKAGWNLAWFSVNPQPDEPGAVLSGLDYEGIWSFQPGAA